MARRIMALTAAGLAVAIMAMARPLSGAEPGGPLRPVLHVQGRLPTAYLFGRGFFEANYSALVANETFDFFGVTGQSLKGDLAPGPANAGYPRGLAGRLIRASLGTGPRLNLFAEVGRNSYGFSIAGLKIASQHYGVRMNFLSETPLRPAVTLEYEYRLHTGPSPLETDGHRVLVIASKKVGQHVLAHAYLGGHSYDVTAESPDGPAPQLGVPLPFFSFPEPAFESGLALTWLAGRRTDLTLGLSQQDFRRPIDDLIPGGGLDTSGWVYAQVSHAVSRDLVFTVRAERHSNMLAALEPHLYNVRSVEAFREPFGWAEFGITFRGDLGRQ